MKLHNEHVPEGRRVKSFQTKPIALKRVAAVLPKEAPARLHRALGAKAPAKARAARQSLDSEKALKLLREECTVAALAKALGVGDLSSRACIDRLRRAGHKVRRVAPSTFRL